MLDGQGTLTIESNSIMKNIPSLSFSFIVFQLLLVAGCKGRWRGDVESFSISDSDFGKACIVVGAEKAEDKVIVVLLADIDDHVTCSFDGESNFDIQGYDDAFRCRIRVNDLLRDQDSREGIWFFERSSSGMRKWFNESAVSVRQLHDLSVSEIQEIARIESAPD